MKLIYKLLFGNVMDEPKECTQNIYVFRYICYCMFFYTIEMLLNELGIFIVDKNIFRRGYLTAVIFLVLYIVFLLHFKFEHSITKYIGITALTLLITAANVSLTYHMVLTLTIPVIVAGMYSSKKFTRYSFVIMILSIIISTYGGYFFGVCDANMVLLTVTSLNKLNNNGTFAMTQINKNPIITLAMFYVLPRCFMAIIFGYISRIVNTVIRKSKRRAIIDFMTGLYNKNKLIEITEEETYINQRIGIIYWDVNHLKYVNDTYGHQAGDQLITRIACSIQDAVEKKGISLRYGGDEFIAIIPNATYDDVEEIISRWNEFIEQIQSKNEYPVSAAVGYALGEGKDLEKIIAIADKNMYNNKQNNVRENYLMSKN